MDISPITSRPHPPLPPREVKPVAPPADKTRDVPAPPAPEARKALDVEFVRHKGANVLRMTDPDTGEVVVQLPPEQVLNLVEMLTELAEKRAAARKDSDDNRN
jgi:hypothetical protein